MTTPPHLFAAVDAGFPSCVRFPAAQTFADPILSYCGYCAGGVGRVTGTPPSRTPCAPRGADPILSCCGYCAGGKLGSKRAACACEGRKRGCVLIVVAT